MWKICLFRGALTLALSLAVVGCDRTCSDGCPDGQFCCGDVCAPEGTAGCGCRDNSDCGGGGGADAICCPTGTGSDGVCTRASECMPPTTCVEEDECAAGEMCCTDGPLANTCQDDCPLCLDDSYCEQGERCCSGQCIPGDCFEDAGPADAGPTPDDAGAQQDAGEPPATCGVFSGSVDVGTDFLDICPLDGQVTICAGGAAGALQFLSARDGTLVERRDVTTAGIYSAITFADPNDPTIQAWLVAHGLGASYIDRQDAAWSFVQNLYGIITANVVQSALLTVGGTVSGLVTADSSRGRLDLAEQDSFNTWAQMRDATITSTGRIGGVACIPDTLTCVVATDANPSEYFRVDFALPSTNPSYVLSLGTAGNSARNGACDANLCVFAELDGGGATVLNAAMSPPTIVETRALGPEPLAVSLATIGGASGFVTMTSDDKIHFLSGSPGAITTTTYSAPGACAGAGPRTAVVHGEGCVAALCPGTGGNTVRAAELGPPD